MNVRVQTTTMLGLPLGIHGTDAFNAALSRLGEESSSLLKVISRRYGARDPLGHIRAVTTFVTGKNVYDARSLKPCDATLKAFERLDVEVVHSVATAMGTTEAELRRNGGVVPQALIHIPQHAGGLGCRPISLLSPFAYLASRLADPDLPFESVQDTIRFIVYSLPQLNLSEEFLTEILSRRPSQRQLTVQFVDKFFQDIADIAFAARPGMEGFRSSILVASRNHVTFPLPLNRFPARDAALLLRYRVGVVENHTPGGLCGFHCWRSCSSKSQPLDIHSSHPFSCGAARANGECNNYTYHNHVLGDLADRIVRLGYRDVDRNRKLKNDRDVDRNRKRSEKEKFMDLTFTNERGERVAVDITQFAPADCTVASIERGARDVYERKMEHYMADLVDLGVAQKHFHVFSFTNTGYMTSSSLDFLRSLHQNAPNPGDYTPLSLLSSIFVHVARAVTATLRKTLSM